MSRKLLVFLIVLAIGFVGWRLYRDWQQRQIIRPIARLAGDLDRTKSLCEGQALAAKKALAHRLRSRREAAKGEKLYNETKAESDGCITLLVSGLTARSTAADLQEIEQEIKRLHAKMTVFLGWVDQLENIKKFETTDSIIEVLGYLNEWATDVEKATQKDIDELKKKLEACRLRSWSELGE